VQFSRDVLRAWKRHAEEEARAMLGRPISGQALDVTVQVVMHRAEDESLLVMGATNLPDGTKLWINLKESKAGRVLGTGKTTVLNGMIGASGFSNQGGPHPHGWYRVEVLGYFNGPWGQPDAVLAIVGRDGQLLAGRYAEPLHPELSESEKLLRAEFDCIAPRLKSARPLDPETIAGAIAIAESATLTVDGRTSAEPVGEAVKFMMSFPNQREFKGWSAEPQANGSVVVRYSFWNGSEPAEAEWIVVLSTAEVRYRNLYGKLMSWTPAD
jgi:hypothetical protein